MHAALALIFSAALKTKIDTDVQSALQNAGAPGATIAIVEDGAVVYARGFGDRDVTGSLPADVATHYEIGSITKQFTAAAILQLKEAGKIDLDAPLARYLPNAPHARSITIRELLTHTSGLPDYIDGPDVEALASSPATYDQLIARVSDKPLQFKPGTGWAYSSTNYLLLGRVVEVVSAESWESYVRAHLFAAAGLTETATIAQEPQLPDMARGYAGDNGKPVASAPLAESWAGPAGGIVSTVGDLAKWGSALASGRIISAADYQLMITPAQLPGGTNTEYGFGMDVDTFAGQPRIWHNGNTFGFDASDQLFPDRHVRIVVLTNSEHGNSDLIAASIYDDLFPTYSASGTTADALYLQAIKAMSGLRQPPFLTYRFEGTGDGLSIGLVVRDGNLWLNMHGGSERSRWQIEHRTFDYTSSVVNAADGKTYLTHRSFFDPTWYGAYRALHEGMLNSQDPAPPRVASPAPAASPDLALKTIAITSVMGTNVYSVTDRGPAACPNGAPGRALKLDSRDHDWHHQLDGVIVDDASHRFCMMRFGISEALGFHGIVEEDYADVNGYWIETGGLIDGTMRAFGIATHHGIWRFTFDDIAFPAMLSL